MVVTADPAGGSGGSSPRASAASSTPAACPSCGREVSPQDNFCEACRTELAPAVVSGEAAENAGVCAFCQSSQISAEGYCESCGHKVPSSRDHTEIDLGVLAGVTDRGLRHRRNEDAMALATAELATGPAAVAVVCDGVSSTRRPDEASLAAAQAAVQVLLDGVRTGADLIEASRDAISAAQEAVAGLGELPGSTPWTLCWLGDSRAYWLGAGPEPAAQRLTLDDSVAGEMVAAGLLSETEALALPQAHVVTGWIGADLSGAAPHVARFEPPGPGALLLCSDGLWNYQPEAAKLAELALPEALSDPLGAATALVTFALEAGGMDNVTVVLAPFPPTPAAARRHDKPAPGTPSVPRDAKEPSADEPA
jgi:serine/threonine protein phosphatase PrpC